MNIHKLRLDQATLDALDASISHWQRYAEGQGKLEGFPTANKCALCQLFNNRTTATKDVCQGCPVKIMTGITLCCHTPYEDAINCLIFSYQDYSDRKFLIAAQAELEFLQSIRDNAILEES